jgi:hypothetical protein
MNAEADNAGSVRLYRRRASVKTAFLVSLRGVRVVTEKGRTAVMLFRRGKECALCGMAA